MIRLTDWTVYWGIGFGFKQVDDELLIILPFFLLNFEYNT